MYIDLNEIRKTRGEGKGIAIDFRFGRPEDEFDIGVENTRKR